jgi:response regulator of citrate/malate metabolism
VRGIRAGGRPIDILAITAAREVEHVRSALALGVVGYLLKPFTFADLRERLEAYRRFREELAGATSASQATVDAMFGELRRPTSSGTSPKGLARDVLEAVIGALTARRYLQYLADEGRVARAQRLGGSGRPEVTFAWRR